jgi:hypothetical protein
MLLAVNTLDKVPNLGKFFIKNPKKIWNEVKFIPIFMSES